MRGHTDRTVDCACVVRLGSIEARFFMRTVGVWCVASLPLVCRWFSKAKNTLSDSSFRSRNEMHLCLRCQVLFLDTFWLTLITFLSLCPLVHWGEEKRYRISSCAIQLTSESAEENVHQQWCVEFIEKASLSLSSPLILSLVRFSLSLSSFSSHAFSMCPIIMVD